MFANKVCDANCNPYQEYSKKIVEEVDAMMSAADAIEARAERRGIEIGERREKVKMLLEFGKIDDEIIQYLTSDFDDPLTEEEAVEVLESCRGGNR